MTTKADILEEAVEVVAGRGKSYGSPEDNFARVANLWRVHLLNRYGSRIENVMQIIDTADVAMMMAMMKIARLEDNFCHHDSWVDLAGYAACGGEIAALFARAAEDAA